VQLTAVKLGLLLGTILAVVPVSIFLAGRRSPFFSHMIIDRRQSLDTVNILTLLILNTDFF